MTDGKQKDIESRRRIDACDKIEIDYYEKMLRISVDNSNLYCVRRAISTTHCRHRIDVKNFQSI